MFLVSSFLKLFCCFLEHIIGIGFHVFFFVKKMNFVIELVYVFCLHFRVLFLYFGILCCVVCSCAYMFGFRFFLYVSCLCQLIAFVILCFGHDLFCGGRWVKKLSSA